MSFDKDFLWGTATSAAQIEGDSGGPRGPSIWDSFSAREGAVYGGHQPVPACAHFDHLEEDLDLLQRLGVKAYRFSLAWTRVMPEGKGEPLAEGLDLYERLVDGLRERGIEPWLTLFHWDLPIALQRQGGWRERSTAYRFAEYTQAVARRLGDRVAAFMPLNEPQVFLGLGLRTGEHAPGRSLAWNPWLDALRGALLGHGMAVQALRAEAPKAKVGCAQVGIVKMPASAEESEIEHARSETWFNPRQAHWVSALYLDPMVKGENPEVMGTPLELFDAEDLRTVSSPIDFVGLNVYNAQRLEAVDAGGAVAPGAPGEPQTNFGWPVSPECMYWASRFHWERYGLPIYITENGMASHDWIDLDGEIKDPARIDFMRRYLRELDRAKHDGVDVRGYFHWSLMDNFEWAAGYSKRFGLVHVDFESQVRTPKQSFDYYRRICAGEIQP